MALARKTGFVKRKPRKVTPEGFLAMLLEWTSGGYRPWRLSAMQYLLFSGTCVSKVGLFKRCGAAVKFISELLQCVLAARVEHGLRKTKLPASLGAFKRVILQDSTCVSLHPRLAKAFPGSSNQSGAANATLRIQASFDVLTRKLLGFTLASFRDNDQKAASDLSLIREGDLVIRDLGYFVLKTFSELTVLKAFFLSRYRHGTHILDPQTSETLNLLKLLRKYTSLDRQVLLGKNEKVPIRIIAVKLPAHVAAERRRKAKADRDKRKNPSKEALALLGWAIYITNIPTDVCKAKELVRVYALRWQIEIVFKAWKSHLHLKEAPTHNPDTLRLFVCAHLLTAILIHRILPQLEALEESSCAKPVGVSLLKLYSVLSLLLPLQLFHRADGSFAKPPDASALLPFITYDSRRKRKNMVQKMAELG